jgi:hypothetical protein
VARESWGKAWARYCACTAIGPLLLLSDAATLKLGYIYKVHYRLVRISSATHTMGDGTRVRTRTDVHCAKGPCV